MNVGINPNVDKNDVCGERDDAHGAQHNG